MQYMSEKDTLRLKSYMVAAGYNISSLAKRINMGRECLSSRINGKIDFGRSEMMEIAAVLGESPEKIFFGSEVA